MRCGGFQVLALALVWITSAPAAFACVPQGRNITLDHVMIDGPITLRGGDGTRYRLAGIVPVSTEPTTRLEQKLAEFIPAREPVRLTLLGDTDRYRRLPVTMERGGEDIALSLLRSGLTRLDATSRQHPCRGALLKAETEAYSSGFHPVLAATDRGALLRATGQPVAVKGRVLSVRSLQKVTYINFGRKDSGALTAIIRTRNRAALLRDGIDPERLKGQDVLVIGPITHWRGPQIDIERAENIRIPDTMTGQQTRK